MKKETKKSNKGNIATAAFFIFSLIVVAIIAFREFGGEQDRALDNTAFNVLYLLGAVACIVVAVLIESFKYMFLLRTRGIKRRGLGFRCAVIGKYYDNLTPAGAGGQGFQMYYLSQNGCDKGTAGGLPIIGLLGLQFAFVFIAIVTMIVGTKYLADLIFLRVTAIVGVVFYAFIPVCIIFFAVAPKLLERIVKWFTGLLGKLHILKHPERAREKAIDSLTSYTNDLHAFGRDKIQILVVAVCSLIYQCALMMMPYFVLHFFGAEIGLISCFCRVVFIYAAIAIILTPGNSGAAEASFYMVFTDLSGGAIFWGMLVWRALCYYSWIVLGAIVQIRERFIQKRNGDNASMPFIPNMEQKPGDDMKKQK